jgi:hypothetical protein
VGGLEAKMAFDAGADMMTVIGGAPLATVEQALDAARKAGKEMLMELTGVRDILAYAKEWREIGVERMVYHRGWDEQTFNRMWEDPDRQTIRRLIDMGFKVTVTGGINVDLLPFFQSLPVSVIICGRGIREASDPRASAHEMRTTINRLWGGTGAGVSEAHSGGLAAASSQAENAAKAIRWGVSEMGLLLTVDGRECPGCDSPQRICWGTATSVQCPAGVSSADIVQRASQIFGRSDAIGRASDGAFTLDPARLANLSPNGVIDLLNATGTALRQLGCQVDVGAGLGMADRILRDA